MKHTEWETAVSTFKTDLEFLKEIKSYGITGIELSVAEWDVMDIDWEGLKNNSAAAGIKVLSYHLPFGTHTDISAIDEETRKKACNFQRALMKTANGIGIERFVIHSCLEPIADCDRAQCIIQSKRSLSELAEYAESLNSVLCVEDLPRSCLGHNVAEMKDLLSADDRLRVCFDVNHLLTVYGSTHREFVEAFGDKIVTCHMSDYDFIDERHYFCGNGLINWDELIGLLEDAGYSGPFLFEGGFSPNRIYPDVPYGTFAEARERHLRIREFKGNGA